MRDLAAEFPNISQVDKLPEQTCGYQRRAQTMLGYAPPRRTPLRTSRSTPATCPSPAPPPSTANQPQHGRADLEELRATRAATT